MISCFAPNNKYFSNLLGSRDCLVFCNCPIIYYSLWWNVEEVKSVGRSEMFNASYLLFRNKNIVPTPPIIIMEETMRRRLICSERITTPPVAAMTGTSN